MNIGPIVRWGFLYILVLAFIPFCTGQTTNYVYTQYTVEEGLPSNECHFILQDSRGFIWIGTDSGVARFDGYNFTIYGPSEGLDDPVIFTMQEDDEGKIWMGGLTNMLYIYDPETDRIAPYPFNSIIKKNQNYPLQIVKNFFKDKDTLYMGLINTGILKIADDGNYDLVEFCYGAHDHIYTFKNRSWIIRFTDGSHNNSSMNVLLLANDHTPCYEFDSIKTLKYDYSEIMSLFSARVGEVNLVSVGGSLYVLEQEKLNYLFNTKKINHASMVQDGNQVLCFDHLGGSRLYSDLTSNKYTTLLNDISVTCFLEDHKGGFWFTSLEDGLIYFKPLKVKYVDFKHGNKNFKFLTRSGGQVLYSAAFSGEILGHNVLSGFSDIIKQPKQEILAFEYDTLRNELWYSNANGIYLLKNENEKTIKFNYSGLPRAYAAKSIEFGADDIAMGSYNSYFTIDGISKEAKTDEYINYADFELGRVFTAALDGEDVYFGTVTGLVRIRNNVKTELGKTDSLLSHRIDKIISTENTLFLATKGAGIVVWDKKGHPNNIDTGDGLSSDFVESIYLDMDANIWASTLNGLNKVTFNQENGTFTIKQFNVDHGMPCKDMYDVEIIDDKIYVATGTGVVEFTDVPINQDSPPPTLIDFFVNSKKIAHYDDHVFKFNENNFTVNFLTLNYQMTGKIPYRYKLNEGDWFYTDKPQLVLPDIEPDPYKLQIQSQNEDNIWSSSLVIPFTVNLPWWKTIWFLIIMILVSILITYAIMYRNFRFKKKVTDIKTEMKTLEKSALKAQMNPHFIFNALNSIQSFIMHNDREQAMNFLSMFARLIRMNLNAINADYITLNEEISMLSHYLDLEQMRFEGKFEYKFSLTENINPVTIKLPPMLIQPVVENAVIHGMSEKESGGLIVIEFTKLDNRLIIKIKDNGNGLSNYQSNSIHKSYGLDIARKRLDLQSFGQTKINTLEIKRTIDEWTEVTMEIGLMDPT